MACSRVEDRVRKYGFCCNPSILRTELVDLEYNWSRQCHLWSHHRRDNESVANICCSFGMLSCCCLVEWALLLCVLCELQRNPQTHCSMFCRRLLAGEQYIILNELTLTHKPQIQEAGLSFYSYIILIRVLKAKARVMFMCIFWFLIAIITALRTGILACRARNILSDNNNYQRLISQLHIGYFISIALIEVVSAGFLLKKFAAAQKTSKEAKARTGLFSYLMRSTEIRLASLALIGITRAVTYSFQETAQSATNTASQVDRFVYTMECMFPVMML